MSSENGTLKYTTAASPTLVVGAAPTRHHMERKQMELGQNIVVCALSGFSTVDDTTTSKSYYKKGFMKLRAEDPQHPLPRPPRVLPDDPIPAPLIRLAEHHCVRDMTQLCLLVALGCGALLAIS